MILSVTPTQFTVSTIKCEHKTVEMEMTEVTIHRWEEPKLTPEEEAQQASYNYFLEIGCEGSRRGRQPVVRLPQAVDEWSIDVEGEYLVIAKVLLDRWSEKRACRFKITLSDPESLPRAMAHMQKHSKFLRGGLGNHIPVIKAV